MKTKVKSHTINATRKMRSVTPIVQVSNIVASICERRLWKDGSVSLPILLNMATWMMLRTAETFTTTKPFFIDIHKPSYRKMVAASIQNQA